MERCKELKRKRCKKLSARSCSFMEKFRVIYFEVIFLSDLGVRNEKLGTPTKNDTGAGKKHGNRKTIPCADAIRAESSGWGRLECRDSRGQEQGSP